MTVNCGECGAMRMALIHAWLTICWWWIGWRKKYTWCICCGYRAAQHSFGCDCGYPMTSKFLAMEFEHCHHCGKLHIVGEHAYLIDKEAIKWKPLSMQGGIYTPENERAFRFRGLHW